MQEEQGHTSRVRSRTPRAVAKCAVVEWSLLPNELWSQILTVDVEARWRFSVRPVCRLWRDLLDEAPMKDQFGLIRGVRYLDVASKRRAKRELRGRLVRASVILIEWPRLSGPDVSPEELFRLCTANAGRIYNDRGKRALTPLDVALALLATGSDGLIDHAITMALPEAVADLPTGSKSSSFLLYSVAATALKIGGQPMAMLVFEHLPGHDFAACCEAALAVAIDFDERSQETAGRDRLRTHARGNRKRLRKQRAREAKEVEQALRTLLYADTYMWSLWCVAAAAGLVLVVKIFL